MKKIKPPLFLNGKFEEVKEDGRWIDVCYIIHEDNEIELCSLYHTSYPILSSEEIFKLAEILKEQKRREK